MRYYTKVIGQPVSEAEAWRRATPQQRASWWPTGAPASVKADAALSGVNLVDGGSLELAMAAGRAAQVAGYGKARADGRYPCGHCVPCAYGAVERCHRPQSRAAARLLAAQHHEPAQVALRQLAAAEGALLAAGF